MGFNEIEQLLEKYFEGKTSLEEERNLESFFTEGQVDPSLAQFQPLFLYYRQQRKATVSADFEERLFARMKQEPKRVPIKRFMAPYWLSAAATVLILIGSWFFYHSRPTLSSPSKQQVLARLDNRDTYQDPRMAMAEVEKALMVVSGNMNKSQKMAGENVAKLNSLDKIMQN